MCDAATVEYMMLPRLAALAEVVWSRRERKDWRQFQERLKRHVDTWEMHGWNYRPLS